MSDEGIKVTDKRMFTPEGELREEYREVNPTEDRTEPEAGAAVEPEAGAPAAAPAEATEPEPIPDETPAADEEDRSRLESPGSSEELGGPGFADLLAMLANPAVIFLGDAGLSEDESVEDLSRARWHINLLDVLRERTAGNLSAQELSALEDLLYQLRLRYVEKKG